MKGTEVGTEEFEVMFRTHAREVHGFLRRRTPADAEDLTSEVFVIAWRRRRDLPAPEMRRAWLLGVARRLVMSTDRETIRARDAASDWRRAEPTPTQAATGERDDLIRELVDSLSDRDRELLTLVAWDGCSVAEAARVLGLRPGTARVRLHRTRQRLAQDPRMQHALEMPASEPQGHVLEDIGCGDFQTRRPDAGGTRGRSRQ